MGNRVVYQPAYEAEVEYLESTGTQWIDTGVKPDNTYTFDCKVAVTQDNYNCIYWGTRNSGDFESENNQCYLNSNGIHFLDRYREINLWSTTAGASSNWSSDIIPSVNTMYELTDMTVVSTMNPMIYPITLFAFNMIGDINTESGKCRIGYWKCYSNGQIVCDFIPVRIGTIGYMYDKVSKQLFANKGTGNFVLGSDVSNAVIPQQRCVFLFPMYDSQVEYLESVGEQWIETGINITSLYTVFIKASFPSSETNCCMWSSRQIDGSKPFSLFKIRNDTLRFDYLEGAAGGSLSYSDFETVHEYKAAANVLYIDNVLTLTAAPVTFNAGSSVKVLANNALNTETMRTGFAKLYRFYIKDESDNYVFDGIPVRIGSTGYMYDKVSKRLFGNKGSGNFILGSDTNDAVTSQRRVGYERIYEEYEWLCGRNGAYIDTDYHPIIGTDVFSVHFRYDGTIRNSEGQEQDVFGVNDGTVRVSAYINSNNYLSCNYYYIKGTPEFPSTGVHNTEWNIYDLMVVGEKFEYNANDISYEFSNRGITPYTFNISLYIFNCNQGNKNYYLDGDISSFKITDTSSNVKMHLIPCKLLQPIPAILDGNGIARQAGTYGLWDKVRNRFYGNVGNSGAFTAKNPKCYEEYEWLIIPYTENNANVLPIYSNNFSFQYIIYSVGNIGGVWTTNKGYAYYPNITKCGIWGFNERAVLHNNSDLIPLGTPFDVECDSNGITMNGELMPNYGSSPYFDRLAIYCYTSTGQYALSKITIDGSVRYVPCKLTHGIPASMDVNSIARPAGTCGIWDKVNDKFYGNVASGTFTVSNN